MADEVSQRERAQMGSENRLKLGLFGALERDAVREPAHAGN